MSRSVKDGLLLYVYNVVTEFRVRNHVENLLFKLVVVEDEKNLKRKR